LILACILVVAFFSLDWLLGLHEKLLDFVVSEVVFFHSKSLIACITYIGAYVVSSLLCVPLTPFEILTGFIFGLRFGVCLDIAGRVTGALISFNIARVLSRTKIECFCVQGTRYMKGIGAAVKEQGLRFVVLFNLAYVPVAVKNYGLGFVPEVSLGKFVTAIFIVEVPMASIWALIGSSAACALDSEGISLSNATAVHDAINGAGGSGSQAKCLLLLIGIMSILVVVHVVQKRVSKALSDNENATAFIDELEYGGSSSAAEA